MSAGMRVRPLLGLGLAIAIWVGLELLTRTLWALPAHPDPLIAFEIPHWTGTRVHDDLLFWRSRPSSRDRPEE